MTIDEARDAVKHRLSIPDDTETFDDLIEGFVADSVRRLYPRAAYEVDSEEITDFVVSDLGETEIDLTTLDGTPVTARKVESYDGFSWSPVSDTYHHGEKLRLRGLTGSEQTLRIYGLKPFPSIEEVYEYLLQAIIWWGVAEYYDYLGGNKKSYNIYMQVSGARAVDNMADQSAYFDSKANQYVDEQAKAHGG